MDLLNLTAEYPPHWATEVIAPWDDYSFRQMQPFAVSYYLEGGKKEPPMYFISENGHDWFVKGDGNHRACIARFDFHYHELNALHGLTIEDWRIDHAFARSCKRLQEVILERRLPFFLKQDRETLAREDNPGWHRETYRPAACIGRHGDVLIRATEVSVVAGIVRYLEMPAYRRFFASSPF